MPDSKPPRSRDPNRLAQLIADLKTGDGSLDLRTEDGKDLAAVLLGRKGGLKGGRARAESMTPERRQEIARLAAAARWKKQ